MYTFLALFPAAIAATAAFCQLLLSISLACTHKHLFTDGKFVLLRTYIQMFTAGAISLMKTGWLTA